MSDRSDRSEARRGTAFEAFEEWLEETANREGSNPETVLDELMSTYWILNELTELMGETEYEDMIEGTPSPDGDSADGDHRAIVEVIESIAKMNAGQGPADATTAPSSIDPGLIQLIEALRPQEGREQTEGLSHYRLDRLRDEVEELSRTLETVTDQTDELDETVDEALARQERRLGRLKQDVTALEAAIEEGTEAEAVEALEERVRRHETEVDERLTVLDERFENAYASIKRILEHLLSSTEGNEQRFEAVVDVVEQELGELSAAHRDYERLVGLKREGNRQNIKQPTCDSCETTIDLPMLSEPYCPNCDRPIVGVDAEPKLFGQRETATTRAPRQGDDGQSSVARRLRERLHGVDVTAGELPDDLALDESA